jgi:hypothetical protein
MKTKMKAFGLVLSIAALAATALWFSRTAAAHPDGSHLSVKTLAGGDYVFALDGYTVAPNQTPRPFAWAGREQYDGNGHVAGVFTASYDGTILHRSYTGTYTVNADGTGATVLTDDHNEVTHFDIFVSEDGDLVSYVETDPGVVSSGYEHRLGGRHR